MMKGAIQRGTSELIIFNYLTEELDGENWSTMILLSLKVVDM